ncbi:MAG: glycosyltransferase [Pseudomonadota bacterium]
MTPKKILLLSVSAGAGHSRAAEAIGYAAEAHPTPITALHVDVLQYAPAGFRQLHTDFYIRLLNKYPAIWAPLYQITHEAQPDSSSHKLRRVLERSNMRGLLKKIEGFAPDAIICTHFLPAEILSASIAKGRSMCPVWVQVTDFGLHRMWVQDHMAGYFAANDEVAFRLAAAGVAPERIHVTGIPVMPGFQPASAHARAMPAGAKRPTLLLMGGGAGLGRLELIAARLLAIEADFALIAVAGSNKNVLKALQALACHHPQRLTVHGYTQRVQQLMACADLVITKPGGLTTSECLAMGVPMLLNTAIPGQEERNADYLLEQGAALKAHDELGLQFRVRQLLADPGALAAMRQRAQALGRPHAAGTVLETIAAHWQAHHAPLAAGDVACAGPCLSANNEHAKPHPARPAKLSAWKRLVEPPRP